MDAGIYPVSFASMIYGELPVKIMSSAHIGETGVDEQFSALFEYEGGRMASLNGSVRLKMTNDAYIFGTKGYIHVPDFLFGLSAYLHVDGAEPVFFKDNRETNGYVYEAEAAMACLRAGQVENDVMPLDETTRIMKVLDAVRWPWNLRYPTEE